MIQYESYLKPILSECCLSEPSILGCLGEIIANLHGGGGEEESNGEREGEEGSKKKEVEAHIVSSASSSDL